MCGGGANVCVPGHQINTPLHVRALANDVFAILVALRNHPWKLDFHFDTPLNFLKSSHRIAMPPLEMHYHAAIYLFRWLRRERKTKKIDEKS